MATFLGEFDHSIDDKRRLALPAVFRKRLPKDDEFGLTVIPGIDECLYVLPEDQLHSMMERLSSQRRGWDELSRAYQTNVGRLGSNVGLDSQGRLSLTELQMKYAGLKDKAIVVGCIDHIQVWNEARYREKPEARKLNMRQLAEHVFRDDKPARKEGGD